MKKANKAKAVKTTLVLPVRWVRGKSLTGIPTLDLRAPGIRECLAQLFDVKFEGMPEENYVRVLTIDGSLSRRFNTVVEAKAAVEQKFRIRTCP